MATVGPLAALLIARIAASLRRNGSTLRDLWFEFSLAAAATLAMVAARATDSIVAARGGFSVHPVVTNNKSVLLAGIANDVRGVLALFGADPGNSPHAWGPAPGGVPAHPQSGPEIAFALIHLLLDLGGVLIADDVLEGVAGNQGEPSVALERLLAGLHDHARRFEFDQGDQARADPDTTEFDGLEAPDG